MNAQQCLIYLVEEIHSTVAATVDEQGLPHTCAIDMMLADEGGLYFLTARGKAFYRRLMARRYLALSGMKGEDTLSTVAVSVQGWVKPLGRQRLEEILEKNPYMREIYPTEASRRALEVFCLLWRGGDLGAGLPNRPGPLHRLPGLPGGLPHRLHQRGEPPPHRPGALYPLRQLRGRLPGGGGKTTELNGRGQFPRQGKTGRGRCRPL